ncbi:SLC22A18 isoform 7 [Pongo abelii]|uniref:SLC22A18 isoform 7 n=1 Tax=Pongo abelii TaxID=9601 RepID=A0A2J8S6I9_PONAB|nr:SLC22A18 isoform 7 [Pongo abelii]
MGEGAGAAPGPSGVSPPCPTSLGSVPRGPDVQSAVNVAKFGEDLCSRKIQVPPVGGRAGKGGDRQHSAVGGSSGSQGPGPVPRQDERSRPVLGHLAYLRAGRHRTYLPLHAVLRRASGPRASVFDLKAIASLLRLPDVPRIFLVKVASNFPTGLFMVMFSIISMDFFQLEAAQAGYLMSFFGLLQMVTQGLVIGQLSSHFSEEALLRASVLVFIVVGLAMAWMSSVFHFCLLVPGLVFSLCALNVVTDSMLTKAVSSSDTGTMLGLCASVQPLLRTLGPTVGGLLYRSFGVPVFGHVQVAINTLVLLVLWRKPMPQRKDKVR